MPATGGTWPARLQVLDVTGRSLIALEVGTMEPRAHAISVPRASPGMYLLKLTQGSRTVARKATLLP
jgi:hypothetical protein